MALLSSASFLSRGEDRPTLHLCLQPSTRGLWGQHAYFDPLNQLWVVQGLCMDGLERFDAHIVRAAEQDPQRVTELAACCEVVDAPMGRDGPWLTT